MMATTSNWAWPTPDDGDAVSQGAAAIRALGSAVDGTLGDWEVWTPSWTNLTVGNGTQASRYVRVGNLVVAYLALTFGSTTTIDGSNPSFTLPVGISFFDNDTPLGAAVMEDANVQKVLGSVFRTVNSAFIRYHSVNGSILTDSPISATNPFTWTTDDQLLALFMYRAS